MSRREDFVADVTATTPVMVGIIPFGLVAGGVVYVTLNNFRVRGMSDETVDQAVPNPSKKTTSSARFLDAALSVASVPLGISTGTIHTFPGAIHHPGFRAPQRWVECGPAPVVVSHRELAEPVCESSERAVLSVGVPDTGFQSLP